jgi:hypothetical protein
LSSHFRESPIPKESWAGQERYSQTGSDIAIKAKFDNISLAAQRLTRRKPPTRVTLLGRVKDIP